MRTSSSSLLPAERHDDCTLQTSPATRRTAPADRAAWLLMRSPQCFDPDVVARAPEGEIRSQVELTAAEFEAPVRWLTPRGPLLVCLVVLLRACEDHGRLRPQAVRARLHHIKALYHDRALDDGATPYSTSTVRSGRCCKAPTCVASSSIRC
jgi:hypothetical protein